jgi:hypothetical protein
MRFGRENTQRRLTSSDALVRRRVLRCSGRSVDEEPCTLPQAALSAGEEVRPKGSPREGREKMRRTMMSGQRRPKRSITYRPRKVQPKLTAPRMICATKGSTAPTDWKMVVPSGVAERRRRQRCAREACIIVTHGHSQ